MLFMVTKRTEMQNKGVQLRSDRTYCLIYFIVILWLLPGLLRTGDIAGIAAYFLYAITFGVTSYFLYAKAPGVRVQFLTGCRSISVLEIAVFIGAASFPFLHWLHLGGIPLLQAFVTPDYIEAALIRQRISENVNIFWRYGSSVIVLSIMPFLVLLLAIKRSYWFCLFSLLAICYAASLLQKSYVLVVFLPTIIYTFTTKRFKLAGILSLISGMAIFILILATNPNLRPNFDLIPRAVAAEESKGIHHNVVGDWVAYGGPMEQDVQGKFSTGAFYFNGNRSIFKERTDSEWEIDQRDFSLEFWVFPLGLPKKNHDSILYWNGPTKIDHQGASYISYGFDDGGETYVKFESTDRSRVFSIKLISKSTLELNKWNHVYAARAGNIFFLGVNGKVVQGSGSFVDLSIDRDNSSIVQFGARFGDDVPITEKRFFNGYIDEIVFSHGGGKYRGIYTVPDKSLSPVSVKAADITRFQVPSRVQELPPSWLPNFLPGWLNGLIHRVVFVPGEVVGNWFAVIPADVPFANGCGYRPVAAMLGCAHQNFPQLVYSIYNRSLVKQGVSGTMNAAGFMDEYANFGLPGLIVSGVIMAVLLYLLGILFAGRRAIGIALNAVPLLFLSSGALLTLLVSGGWLTTLLLYVVFYSELDNGLEGEVCAV